MQIHQIKNFDFRKKKKRVGRGGKRGTFSGHGMKGQKSRAGHRIRPAERDLLQRLPKLRGVKNKPLKNPAVVINVGDLDKYFDEINLNRNYLLKKKIIRILNAPVKILGGGSLKKAYIIEGLQISKQARQKIEAAGGKII